MNKSFIPVFFCTDNNYAIPAYIALYSLLQNYKGNLRVKAFVLVSKDFSEKFKRLLNTLSDRYDFFEITIICAPDTYDSVSINCSHVSTATLYRLLIPRILNKIDSSIEKCIYLDSDIVVEGDIAELYDVDIEGYYIGGVRDRALSCDEMLGVEGYKKKRKMLGIPSLNNYINAGVLLMNLKEIKEKRIDSELENTGYRNDFPYNDQDVINTVCYSKIKTLPLKFNAMTTCLYHNSRCFYEQYGRENIIEARQNPVILHYILKRKPWSCSNLLMAENWWKYVKMQDTAIMQEYIQPFLLEQNVSMHDWAREAAKKATIKMGVYNLIRKVYYWWRT